MIEPGTLPVLRQAFGCGEALGITIAALGRPGEAGAGALLWPHGSDAAGEAEETVLLLAGAAQEVAYGREGGVLVLHVARAGEFFGALLAGGVAASGTSQVEALAAVRLHRFATPVIVRLMESYACVALALTRAMAERLAALRARMIETALLSATGRIAAELLRRARAAEDWTIRPLPVWSELAVQVQSTRETVSRTVSNLEKRGVLLRVEGGLRVVAPHRLEEWVY